MQKGPKRREGAEEEAEEKEKKEAENKEVEDEEETVHLIYSSCSGKIKKFGVPGPKDRALVLHPVDLI